jgi:hypothetical protein
LPTWSSSPTDSQRAGATGGQVAWCLSPPDTSSTAGRRVGAMGRRSGCFGAGRTHRWHRCLGPRVANARRSQCDDGALTRPGFRRVAGRRRPRSRGQELEKRRRPEPASPCHSRCAMNWLQRFFEDRLADVFCGNIHCTTCGGVAFWRSASEACEAELARIGAGPDRMDWCFLVGLRELRPPAFSQVDWGAAVVALLYRVRGWRETDLFAGTWVGELLVHRDSVDSARAEARRRHAEFASPEAGRIRRDVARLGRQEAHALRLQKQRERSLWWHARQRDQGG